MDEELFFFNGLDGASGEFLVPPLTAIQISAIAQGHSLDPDELAQLKLRAFELQNPHAGVEADARDLSQTGWGVVFAQDASPAVKEALSPLLQHRARQAGGLYKEFTGPQGYRKGETKLDFLVRHGAGPGPVAPEQVPYYLLLVGDPEAIPYRFQCQLDVQYAVGRVHFATLEEYDHYARSVLAAESGFSLPATATFFGVANEDDKATHLSLENLIEPLAQHLIAERARWGETAPAWQVQAILKEDATKARLSELLNGPQAPALLFSASHGIAFPNGDARQLPHQGALVCQDWPGPIEGRGPIKEDIYFSASDLSRDANLLGTIAFFFACYGAGTPPYDEFSRQIWQGQPDRKQIAPHAFIAHLPQRMLGLPRGGALAVIGHIERAWGSSFFWGRAGRQLTVFEDALERLLRANYPVGYALEVFNNRFAEISTDLNARIEDIQFGMRPNDLEMANLWTANNDARNYVVLGDPAVRMAVGSPATPARPVLEAISLPPAAAAGNGLLPPAGTSSSETTGETPPAGPISRSFDAQPAPEDGAAPAQGGLAPQADLLALANELRAYLNRALHSAGPLEVATYTSPDVSGSAGSQVGKLFARTCIGTDGCTQTWVTEEPNSHYEALLHAHHELVAQAQAARAALLDAAALLVGKQ